MDVIYTNTYTKIYDCGDNKIMKVCRDVDKRKYGSHSLISSINWQGRLPKIYGIEWDNCQLKVIMERCNNIDINSYYNIDSIYSLIECLGVMEAHGIIHGDIKVENIVEMGSKLAMVDFDYLYTRSDVSEVLQTYRDVNGYAIQQRYIPKEYSAINAAIYALGITICKLVGALDDNLYKYENVIKITKSINDVDVLLNISTLAFIIDRCYSDIVSKIEDENISNIVSKCICPVSSRAKSFLELIPHDTRWIYDKCIKEGKSCKDTAIIYEGYYRYRCTDIEELRELSKGDCLLWIDEPNQSSRLLNEYNNPGSWYVEIEKCWSLDELKETVMNRSPCVIMYCFNIATLYVSRDSLMLEL